MAKKLVRRSGGAAPAKPKKAKAAKKNGRRMDEATLRAKYPQVIAGSLQEGSGAHAGKMTVQIKCAERACPNEPRRVATSDLFQVTRCVEHTKGAKSARKTAKAPRKVTKKAAAAA